jgi:BMFP domain-containing protein YqiC
MSHNGLASLRQPQLELKPFDRARLIEVALKLRAIFLEGDRARLDAKVTPAFIERLVDSVTEGFRGDVGVVPRQFLRRFVNVLDIVSEHEDFDPFSSLPFKPEELRTRTSGARLEDRATYDPEPGDEKGYESRAVEW